MTAPSDQRLLGCLGGGQLARMLAIAGRDLGVRLRVLDPHPDACAQHACEHVCASYDDTSALDAFLDGLDALTFEFESIPAPLCDALEDRVPLRPSARSLRACQDRMLEKRMMERAGLDVHPWAPVESEAQLQEAMGRVGLPAVLKRRTGGYDGKGQRVIRAGTEALDAWHALECAPCIAEAFVPFTRELSQVGARSHSGEVAFYPLVENIHEDGILRATIAPALRVDPKLRERAHTHASALMNTLDHVGVFTIEFFEAEGVLYANETAPRVHNSGHWTIEGARTSQFEQHLRCVLGLGLGSTEPLGPSAMVNLIGVEPGASALDGLDGVHTHLYGKAARPGRKIGHLTTVRHSPEERDAVLTRMRSVADGGTLVSDA